MKGGFAFMGEKAKRKEEEGMCCLLRKQKGTNDGEESQKGQTLKWTWDEMVIPAPCAGVTLWAAYATLTKLSAFGKCRPEDLGK